MKIKLYSNGQIINPPERVAKRYLRLGRACLYVEPKPEPKPVIEPEPVIEVEEEIPEEVVFRDFEPVEQEPEIQEVKPKRKPKKKKEEVIEG
jgi:outer membrane biosynthesis protein TonB